MNTNDKIIGWSLHEIYNIVNSLNRGFYKLPLYDPHFTKFDLL